MARRQQGITLMGFLMVLVVVGAVALIVMKLFPMYTEFYNAKGAMEEFAASPGSGNKPLPQIQREMERRFDVAYVSTLTGKDIKVAREGRVLVMSVNYEVRKEMIGNLDVVGRFSHSVELQGTGGGG
jgi:Tfp pilus assembly protein PilE